MPTIVHITADYPDAFARSKTLAVRSFLALTPQYRHVVYSLNRVDGIGGIQSMERCSDVTTIAYRAPPFGLLLERCLEPVGRLIVRDLARRNISPDLVHAHKLTVDGIVARKVSVALSSPMICNVWGNTDQKIIAAKPLSRAAFRAIANHCHSVLAATPWACDYVTATLGVDPRKVRVVPVVCQLKPAVSSAIATNRVATLFNLDDFAGKNVRNLIDAVALLRRRGRPVELDIYGGGREASYNVVRGYIRRAGCQSTVVLRGHVAHDHVQETLNRYGAFAMPSRRETFGMVFIEALFAGVPILYPKGQSIDGFFDTVEIGCKCNARSVDHIAHQLDRVLADEPRLKRNIRALHGQGFSERLSRIRLRLSTGMWWAPLFRTQTRKLAVNHTKLTCCCEARPTGYAFHQLVERLGHDSVVGEVGGGQLKTNHLPDSRAWRKI